MLLTADSKTAGLYLKLRIDGGPVLRMLLDSGARYIVLDRGAARSLRRKGGAPFDLVGFGASSGRAKMVEPGTVEIGDLVLRNCPMLTVDGTILDGVDGVLPLSLFADFLVRLDVSRKTLELDPYPSEPVRDESFSPARKDRSMLFLAATLNESHEGLLLLDTGASYNAVASAEIRKWKAHDFLSKSLSLIGAAGIGDGLLLPRGMLFRVGSRVLVADPAVVVDLSDLTRHHNFEISGVLGYPALRDSVVTVDYRDSLVRMARK